MIPGHMNKEERQFIFDTVVKYRPNLLVECGTWKGGGSTLALFEGMRYNNLGHLYTFEVNTTWYTEAVHAYQHYFPEECTKVSFMNMDFIVGVQTLDIQNIDLALLDGNGTEPLYALASFKALEPRFSFNSVVVAHDWNQVKQSKLREYVTGRWNSDTCPKSSVGLVRLTRK